MRKLIVLITFVGLLFIGFDTQSIAKPNMCLTLNIGCPGGGSGGYGLICGNNFNEYFLEYLEMQDAIC